MSDAAAPVALEAPAWAPELRLLGRADYQPTFAAMKQITLERPSDGREAL